ncbi:MAG: histidine kinase [Prevotella sp.]|nr:histidine kinase [Prevotella sp.]
MNNKKITILMHVATWLIMFGSPLMVMNHGNGVSWLQFLMMSAAPLAMLLVFYANYLWLTPRFLFSGERRYFWLINTVIIVCLGIGLHLWMEHTHQLFEPHPHLHQPKLAGSLFFILRDCFNLAIAATIATALQMALRWQRLETAHREAEAARVDAELSNLRNQINPHFLLNTLNNIYALTAFDAERAQQAIQELSQMLRHILYDNQQPLVPLADEIEFLRNYINLMKIRLPQNVDVQFNAQYQDGQTKVAPLLLISLIENAFKHGVSPTQPSFIHININADATQTTCDISNSNFPKTEQDRSGHGIGLTQVQQRLDLAYPNRYTWERGTNADNTIYHSKIIIQ